MRDDLEGILYQHGVDIVFAGMQYHLPAILEAIGVGATERDGKSRGW